MKRVLALIVCFILVLSFSACGPQSGGNGKIKIVTTVFPIYDWVRNIVGDNKNVDVTLLLDSGTDLHSFVPSADDIIKIATCDMFVFVGGESDKWVEDALSEKQNEDMIAINLFAELGNGKITEEIKEGMEVEEENEDAPEYDEHIWLSVKNAQRLCKIISDNLCIIDPENKKQYEENTKSYIITLMSIDKDYADAVSAGNKKTLVFGDRFPFRYLTEDYGIDYYAAFVGCSAESEASFKTVVFLANKVDDLGLGSIIKIEGSDGKLANTVKENTRSKSAEILTLNSMQSVTKKQLDDGATYVGICKKNLEVLREALK